MYFTIKISGILLLNMYQNNSFSWWIFDVIEINKQVRPYSEVEVKAEAEVKIVVRS